MRASGESAHARGYDWRWRRFAKSYLCRNPLCVLCHKRGLIVAAQCVDHIDQQGPLGEHGYDEENLRALCKQCHDSLDAQNRPKQGCDANGYPIE